MERVAQSVSAREMRQENRELAKKVQEKLAARQAHKRPKLYRILLTNHSNQDEKQREHQSQRFGHRALSAKKH